MATFRPAITKLKVTTVIGGLLFAASSNGFAKIIHDKIARSDSSRPVSSLQVVNYIERKYKGKGKGIGFKKTPTEKFPDCYVVRFMTHEGELDIVKINCK